MEILPVRQLIIGIMEDFKLKVGMRCNAILLRNNDKLGQSGTTALSPLKYHHPEGIDGNKTTSPV